MISNPEDYCTRTIAPTLNLTLWTDSMEAKACRDGATVLQERCNTTNLLQSDCFPCAYVISYIFTKYESYVVTAIENTF